MENKKPLPPKIYILRWIARLWSLAIFVLALVIVFSPDPHATGEPIPATTYVLLGLWGLSVVGLMVAWLWERVGALVAIAALVLRELLYLILSGSWVLNFLIVWLAFLPPAVLFLLASHMERKLRTT